MGDKARDKQERLAAALRENLRKRKAHARKTAESENNRPSDRQDG